MIDILEPSDDSYNVARSYEDTYHSVRNIETRNKPVIAVGGTALYIKALLYGLFEGPGSDNAVRDRLLEQVHTQGLPALYESLTQIDPDAAQKISVNDQRRMSGHWKFYQVTGKPISSFQTQFDASNPRHDWLIIGLRRDKELESRRIQRTCQKNGGSGSSRRGSFSHGRIPAHESTSQSRDWVCRDHRSLKWHTHTRRGH